MDSYEFFVHIKNFILNSYTFIYFVFMQSNAVKFNLLNNVLFFLY